MTTSSSAPYAARLSVDYPDRDLDRTSTLLRIFFVIPIAVVLGTIGGQAGLASDGFVFSVGAAGFLFLPTLLLVVFRQKYPRWWFDFNLQLARFANRVAAYVVLMSDEYPSTDEEQYVHLELDYPDVPRELNQYLPLVKWLLAIPHFIALLFLAIGAVFAVIAAWFAIVFTGRYPKGVFDYVEGVLRWGLRVEAYAVLLITDEYPPFALD